MKYRTILALVSCVFLVSCSDDSSPEGPTEIEDTGVDEPDMSETTPDMQQDDMQVEDMAVALDPQRRPDCIGGTAKEGEACVDRAVFEFQANVVLGTLQSLVSTEFSSGEAFHLSRTNVETRAINDTCVFTTAEFFPGDPPPRCPDIGTATFEVAGDSTSLQVGQGMCYMPEDLPSGTGGQPYQLVFAGEGGVDGGQLSGELVAAPDVEVDYVDGGDLTITRQNPESFAGGWQFVASRTLEGEGDPKVDEIECYSATEDVFTISASTIADIGGLEGLRWTADHVATEEFDAGELVIRFRAVGATSGQLP